MLDAKQREARRRGVGGSDAGVVLGYSKWGKTPYELWCEKTKGKDGSADARPDQNASRKQWGNRLEATVLDAFVEESGIAIEKRDVQLVHPRMPFILGSLDGLAADGCPVEAKTTDFRNRDDWGDGGDEIPDYYMPQVQHYLSLYPEAPGSYVAVLIGGNDFRRFFVPRDSEFIEDMLLAEKHFWEYHVVGGIAPEPTSLAGMNHRFRMDDGTSMEVDSQMAMRIADIKDVRGKIDDLEAQEERMKLDIMLEMKEAQALTYTGRTILTWKTRAGTKRFDAKRFSRHHPALYEQFAHQGEPIRTFLVK